MSRWDESEADPRVHWALKILDDEGEVHHSLLRVISTYVIGGAAFGSGQIVQNLLSRRPLYAAIHRTVLLAAAGLGVAHAGRMWAIKTEQRETAVMKHYIMTNPEKFLQPEDLKYGHKSVLLAWAPIRS